MGGVIGVGALAVGAAVASNTTKSAPTPIMIYAKKCYGIEYADFTDAKFNTKAKIDLGVDDKSKLIKDDERKKNFELFKKNNFTDGMTVRVSGDTPEPNMKAYGEIKKYALSNYGSIMIKRILNEPKKSKFLIGVSDSVGVKAHGQYLDNFIVLPVNFPSAKIFKVSKQKISGAAILHHEFEHTQHGKYKNVDLNRDINEEWRAVRYSENSVRIINGFEPRYVYYQNESKKTINIL